MNLSTIGPVHHRRDGQARGCRVARVRGVGGGVRHGHGLPESGAPGIRRGQGVNATGGPRPRHARRGRRSGTVAARGGRAAGDQPPSAMVRATRTTPSAIALEARIAGAPCSISRNGSASGKVVATTAGIRPARRARSCYSARCPARRRSPPRWPHCRIAVIGYSGSVAIAHVFLTTWGTVIVLLMV